MPVRSREAQVYRRLYSTARWRRTRAAQLAAYPLCAACTRAGFVTAATVCDHVRPHKGDEALFFDPSNLQSLCAPHHDSSKQREESLGYSGEADEFGWPVDCRHPANKLR